MALCDRLKQMSRQSRAHLGHRAGGEGGGAGELGRAGHEAGERGAQDATSLLPSQLLPSTGEAQALSWLRLCCTLGV